VQLIENLSPIIHREILRLLDIAARASLSKSGANSGDGNVLCAVSCLSIARALKVCQVQADEIGDYFGTILKLYLDSGFAEAESSEPGQQWANAVAGALKIMVDVDDECFAECFRVTGELLLSLVPMSSKDVRAEVGRAIRKRLAMSAA
jgi:hypothetical protein